MPSRFISILALTLALAACGPQDDQAEVEIAPRIPSIETRAVDGFEAVGGQVVDFALLPNRLPFLGRGIAALDGGGFALMDFAEGLASPLDGPRVGYLAAAPDFQLRGAAAPLLIAAGGELRAPQAWVFLAEEGQLIDMPLSPIATQAPIRAMCAERSTEALIDLIIFTEAGLERWRVSDRGGETLAAEMTSSEPVSQEIVACATVNGELVGVTAAGVTRVLGGNAWGYADGADVTSVETSEGWWTIVARPEQQGASLIGPLGEEVDVDFIEGLNTPSTPAPTRILASPENFGGAYSGGVLLLAQEDTVTVVDVTTVIVSARSALRGGS